ncbi:MAG: anti-sigma regulatory factor [Bacteroidales bacterium]|jgi:anti-sigma regulatory factor (Ser/Thr protein kinase)|nr:anti-sigma regulatory factor [Bacteroidales bacterium]MDD4156117.1 ATP-binding protein [Candidatus Cloacimonadota bacterium]
MAIYESIKPEKESTIKQFLDNPPEPEMSIDYEVNKKDFVNSGKASSDIKLLLKKLGVSTEVLRRVAVASYEAEINITAHSQGGKIVCNLFSDLVQLFFIDIGNGIKDLEKALEPGFSTADDLVREMGFGAGLGLPNIKKNSDYMKIVSEYNDHTELELLIFF